MEIEIAQLQNYQEFIKIMDGNRPYYGGDQLWFKDEKYKKYGCAAVAASNILASFHKTLYPYNNYQKESFMKFMEEVGMYLKPREKVGMINPKDFIEGVIKFGKSKEVELKAHFKYLNVNYHDLCEFIKIGLRKNSPIAMLMLRNEKLREFDWHWMTITKYFYNGINRYIEISTWGERRIIRLEDYYKYSNYGALIYFDSY